MGEGWKGLATHYDDGGISGGTMERPGLQCLLADVERGLIDIVVVYKVDRLTRSLTDFGRIIERFDAKDVSFVSVTQAFNTTTSMGRLTLNVLLSFAQFEREVTGERIRDKIAASKKKGMWMGGAAPFGYDRPSESEPHKLQVNPVEAPLVRKIFERYLALGSVHHLQREFETAGVRSKTTIAVRSGRARGGVPLNRGALYHLLRNKTYLGLIVHGEETYSALHPAIVDADVFEAVAARLNQNTVRKKTRSPPPVAAMLRGRVFDAFGSAMSPTVSAGRTRVYRYYVSTRLQRGDAKVAGAIQRIPARQLEAFIEEVLQRFGHPLEDTSPVLRVEIHPQHAKLSLDAAAILKGPAASALSDHRARLRSGESLEVTESGVLEFLTPRRLQFLGGRSWILDSNHKTISLHAKTDPAVPRALRSAHAKLAERGIAPNSSIAQLRQAKGVEHPHLKMIARLAFLAPDIQAAILDGRLPPQFNVASLSADTLPLAWADQRELFGL